MSSVFCVSIWWRITVTTEENQPDLEADWSQTCSQSSEDARCCGAPVMLAASSFGFPCREGGGGFSVERGHQLLGQSVWYLQWRRFCTYCIACFAKSSAAEEANQLLAYSSIRWATCHEHLGRFQSV